jgi:putative pyruvate formate lyase activating enzyme
LIITFLNVVGDVTSPKYYMFDFPLPDALAAFEDPGVLKALGRYVEVSLSKRPAKFNAVRGAEVEVDLGDETDFLWREHDDAVAALDFENPGEKVPRTSLMDLKIELARRMLTGCHFCERRCGADRTAGETGFCGCDATSRLSSEFLHMGEEACLVPSHTFFFTGCPLYCIYCQNWTISRRREEGIPVTGPQMAEMAKRRRIVEKSRNVNLVGGDPTPNTHTILEMLRALEVNVPIVWNSNMYMSEETMRLLDGCMDVYLTDLKYGNNECAHRLSKVENYWEVVTRNHLLGKKQAELLVRHLVLPNHIECCSAPIIEWIAENFTDSVRLNIMSQYRPEFEAFKASDIGRGVTSTEMEQVFALARKRGLNLD